MSAGMNSKLLGTSESLITNRANIRFFSYILKEDDLLVEINIKRRVNRY